MHPADHGVHLAGRGPLLLAEAEEGGIGALRPVRGAPGSCLLLPRLVGDLAPELDVPGAGVALLYPSVDGGGAHVEGV